MERTLELALVFVLIGTTLAFGGVQPVTYTLAEIFIFLGVFLLFWKQTQQGEILLRLPILPVLFGLAVFLQTIPLPFGLIAHLSPTRLLDPQLIGPGAGSRHWATLSIYPHDTVLTLLKFLAYLGAFLLAVRVFDSRKGKSTLLTGLIFLGCFEAVYGILQYLTGSNKFFGYTTPSGPVYTIGTYINRNHYAGLLELTLPFVFAAAFYYFLLWSGGKLRGPDGRVSVVRTSAGFQSVFWLFLLVIMVVGVIFSRSRMGILGTAFIVVFMALFAQLKARRRVWTVGIVVFLVCVAGYGLWIGLDPVLARFEHLREPDYLQMEGRVAIWRDSLRLIRDYPLTGTGLGTFGVAFRPYQTDLVNYYVDHAHNDYLEFASETGLLGASLLFLPILYLLGRMIYSYLEDPSRFRRSATLGCVGSTLALLLHSIADFNLHIPANALLFAVVLGVGYKAAVVERREEQGRKKGTAENRNGMRQMVPPES